MCVCTCVFVHACGLCVCVCMCVCVHVCLCMLVACVCVCVCVCVCSVVNEQTLPGVCCFGYWMQCVPENFSDNRKTGLCNEIRLLLPISMVFTAKENIPRP